MASSQQGQEISPMDRLAQSMNVLANMVNQQATMQNDLSLRVDTLAGRLEEILALRPPSRATSPPRQPTPAPQQGLAPTFAMQKIKLDLPPTFDGKPQVLQGWLFQVEQYCQLVGMASPTDMVKLAVSRLTKEALVWWRQLVYKGHEYALGSLLWSDFKEEIKGAFADVDRELKLRRRLQSLRQQNSVANYTKQFREIVLELGEAAPDDSALLFTYTEGLKPNVQMQVYLQRPTLLVEAEQLAERADMALFSSNRSQPRQQPRGQWQERRFTRDRPRQWNNTQQHNRDGPVPMELGTMQRAPIQQRTQSMQQRPMQSRRQVVCYNCGEAGHIRRMCPKPVASPIVVTPPPTVLPPPPPSEQPKN